MKVIIYCADCGQKYTFENKDEYKGCNCGQCGAPLDDDWRKSRNYRRVNNIQTKSGEVKTFLDLLSMDVVELEDNIDHIKKTIDAIREAINVGGK